MPCVWEALASFLSTGLEEEEERKKVKSGWRDGSVAQSVCCSCKGPGFGSVVTAAGSPPTQPQALCGLQQQEDKLDLAHHPFRTQETGRTLVEGDSSTLTYSPVASEP